MTDVDAAWDRAWEALPARWIPELLARDRPLVRVGTRTTGRGKVPRSVTGTGDSEATSLLDLDAQLRGMPRERNDTHLEDLRRRIRMAYVDGAEEFSIRESGRPLTQEELEGVLQRFRG